MRRFYQESWQGIPFTAFSHISFFRLAEPRFYATFYEELFRRYQSWNDLPAVWRKNKSWDAKWLAEKIKNTAMPDHGRPLRVLSIGSGVGFMEMKLLEYMPEIELHVNEPSTVGMKWLRQLIPPQHIYIGLPPACLPSDIEWDVIYLSAVDYGIPARELTRLLDELRSQLRPGGQLICISASLLEEYSIIGALVNSMKIIIRCFLHYLSIRRQQFWGWRRTRREYQELFKKAGFEDIQDGILDDGFESYWISGNKNDPDSIANTGTNQG